MSEIITNRDGFVSQQNKTLAVDLPDMGKTVHVLKGTWGLAGKFEELKGEIPKQMALLLATPDGDRLFSDSEEDLKLIGDRMTLYDMVFLIRKWAESNGITPEGMEARLKNSEASLNGASVSA